MLTVLLNGSWALKGEYHKKDSRIYFAYASSCQMEYVLELGGAVSGRNVAGWSVRQLASIHAPTPATL